MRLLSICFFTLLSMITMAQENYLLVGTYTGTGSQGIYVYHFEERTGEASLVSHTEGIENPSYLAVSKDGRFVYAVKETHGDNPPMVYAFALDKKTGKLSFINQQPTGGDDPCYVAISPGGKFVTVGNYSGGSVSLFKVSENGSLQQEQVIQHSGKSVNEKRQERAHVHATVFAPDGDYLFTPDLGMDKIMAYKFEPSAETVLTPAARPSTETAPGSGPRHLVFHPTLPMAYLVEELAGFVSVYRYADGELKFIEKIATHADSYMGAIGSADIHVSPDGKFLYASNRGDQHSITIFQLDKEGKPSFVAEQSTLGKTPRNFFIHPSGKFLLVANQNSDEVVIFKRDMKTGMLTDTGNRIQVPKPVCIQMTGN